MNMYCQFACIGFLLSIITFANGCKQYEKCVYEEIFTNKSYNNRIRPVLNPNDTVQIKVQLIVLGLQNIVELDGTMIISAFFKTEWTDPMLTWNPARFGGVQSIVVTPDVVWKPDIALSNSADKFYDVTYSRDFHVRISYNGRVYWPFGGIFSTNCDISLRKYPFDNQTCSIDIESWLYTYDKVDLNFYDAGGLITARIGTNTLWVLTATNTQRVLKYNKSYRRLTFILEFTRKSLYYYINIIIPTVLLMLVALGVFWLPSGCGEKISLAITVLLAFSVFQIFIMGSTPANSDVVPEITQFVLVVMIMATISLLTSMVVIYISGKDPHIRPPLWLRKLCLNYLSRMMFMDIAKLQRKERKEQGNLESNMMSSSGIENFNIEENENLEINSYNKRRLNSSTNDKSTVKVYHTDTQELMYVKKLRTADKANHDNIHGSDVSHTESKIPKLTSQESHLVSDIRKIVSHMDGMKNHTKKSSETNRHQYEWTSIGKVVDRLLFWLTFLLLVAMIAFIFVNHRT